MKLPLLYAMLFLPVALTGQVAVMLEKMNVVYLGLENPMTVVVDNLPDSLVVLTADWGTIHKRSAHKYLWRADCNNIKSSVTFIVQEKHTGDILQLYTCRTKPILATMTLGMKLSRSIICGVGEFKAQGGIIMTVTNMEIDAQCDVEYFTVIHARGKGHDLVTLRNYGGRYNPKVGAEINKAKPGDVYYFTDVKYKCFCKPIFLQPKPYLKVSTKRFCWIQKQF
jgi:hypothetical protein